MFKVSDRPAPFEELAMPLLSPLYNYALWLTKNTAEAEDLVQETFVKGMKGFTSFTAGTNFRAWIYRILRNTFLTSRTGLRAVPALPIDDVDDVVQNETAEAAFITRMDAEAVRRAIDDLPLVFREVLLLCDIEEMSYREIAETLAIPVGTVTSRLMRARRKVREAMQR